jgi:hypothetical protein
MEGKFRVQNQGRFWTDLEPLFIIRLLYFLLSMIQILSIVSFQDEKQQTMKAP